MKLLKFFNSISQKRSMKLKISPSIEKMLRKAHYGIFNHSTVQICHWTKKSLNDEGECYKNKFYGIETHRCMEFSPAGAFCEMRCIFCWRFSEFMKTLEMKEEEVDEPKELIEGLLKERKRLLSGFKGSHKVNLKKLEECSIPSHFAISLSGEPTLYPKLPKLIRYLKSLHSTKSIFLVTNGQEPEMLEKLEKEDSLPTQLYLSVNAPNKELFKKICCPLLKDAWERFNKSLEFVSRAKCRTVLRLTMIKGLNFYSEKLAKEYAKLIEKANPHFVEIKSYMHVGFSTKRLKQENMLTMEEIRFFAKKLEELLPNFKIMDEHIPSLIVVLQNKERLVDRWIIKPKTQ